MSKQTSRTHFTEALSLQLENLKTEGLYKSEQVLDSPQQGEVELLGGDSLINLCANNYLGFSNHPALVSAAQDALQQYGFGMSSVRFICGTQAPHARLEARLSAFLQHQDAILFPSCFDANTGLFETLLDEQDAIISDALNHASIIDGVRLCKAQRFRYANNDMDALEDQLKAAQSVRYRLIVTDGVFSMDGSMANLVAICDLADRYDALVMVDDSHAVGFVGEHGRGTPEAQGVEHRIDILTGTLGKALGGASGGYVAASAEIVDWLRQRARPYLFSNAVAPMIAHAGVAALDLVTESDARRQQLWGNTRKFRSAMQALGFELLQGAHPIVPIMLRDPKLAQQFASALRANGVLVTAFSFPVVPRGEDRIRTQMSAAHSPEMLEKVVAIFADVGRQLKIIP